MPERCRQIPVSELLSLSKIYYQRQDHFHGDNEKGTAVYRYGIHYDTIEGHCCILKTSLDKYWRTLYTTAVIQQGEGEVFGMRGCDSDILLHHKSLIFDPASFWPLTAAVHTKEWTAKTAVLKRKMSKFGSPIVCGRTAFLLSCGPL